MKKRILAYLVGDQETASTRLRLLQYLPYLRQAGIGYRILFPSKSRSQKLMRYLKSMHGLLWADSVYVQKSLLPPSTLRRIKSMGKRLIFDYDDALFALPEYIAGAREKKTRRLEEVLKSADLVICGNKFLDDYTRRFNPHTRIIPTPVDTQKFKRAAPYSYHSPLIIGWIGHSKNQVFLQDLLPAFQRIVKQHPAVKFRVVSDGKHMDLDPGLEHAFEFIPWQLEQEPAEIQNFAIGIMPVRDDDWSKGKCGLKLLQYMAMEVPVVGTPVGMNTEIIANGVNGYWAQSQVEWADRLSTLIANDRLRREMGINGAITAQDYSLSKLSVDWIDAVIHG